MPRKPLATGLSLVVALLALAACSSDDSSPPPDDKSTGGTTTAPTKLKRIISKDGIKNVFAKTESGTKISLYAASPGHEIMEQTYDAEAKTWSTPASVFKDDSRFCHEIKLKATNDLVAATVICSISALDTDGTLSSYVLGSTDGTSWKRMDLTGASGKPSISPAGNFVSWESPTRFLLWNPASSFTTVKYTQSADTPTVGVMQNNGTLLLIKATPGQKDTCTISFQTASAKAPTVRPLNSTRPQAGHPQCVAISAKLQGPDVVIANFNSTSTTKVDDKKVTDTTTFALAFARLDTGKWAIKTS
ncbi:MAG: hypothetical protein WKF54_06645 [Nocardioidaceae bacterium]